MPNWVQLRLVGGMDTEKHVLIWTPPKVHETMRDETGEIDLGERYVFDAKKKPTGVSNSIYIINQPIDVLHLWRWLVFSASLRLREFNGNVPFPYLLYV